MGILDRIKKDDFSPIGQIAKTGFYVSVASYFVFWVMELVRPGFVSRVFSIHLLALFAIVFAFVWLYKTNQRTGSRVYFWLFSVGLALVSVVITWNLGSGFGDFRVLMAIAALLGIFLAGPIIKNDSH